VRPLMAEADDGLHVVDAHGLDLVLHVDAVNSRSGAGGRPTAAAQLAGGACAGARMAHDLSTARL
jgi:hypothetical protein